MASFVKDQLKSARSLISKKDFSKAKAAATDVLSYEPDNYHANVFLGLASYELKQYDESEQAYRTAAKADAQQPLAWQGLCKLYEITEEWNKLEETLLSLAQLHSASGDAVKCAETLQKYIELRRQRGSRTQIIDALALLLPGSTFYSTLSALPPPDPTAPTATTTSATQSAIHNSLPTIEEIVRLTEIEEADVVKKEVEKRRFRLGSSTSTPEEIRKEVGLELWSKSKLPELYDEIINHANTSDELRRDTEAKLLRYKHRYRCALPPNGDGGATKLKLRKEIQSMIDGVVLLNIPDELAWTLYIEGWDCKSVDEHDFGVLRKFLALFPVLPLSRLIRGYSLYNGLSPFEEEDEESRKAAQPADDDIEPYDLILEAYSALPDSILAHRIVGDIYNADEDYKAAIPVAERGLELVKRFESDTAIKLPKTQIAMLTALGTALVHLFPPKHHARATRILDDVLSRDADYVPALMSRAYIHQAARRWSDARELFEKTAQLLGLDDVEVSLLAREEAAWCTAEEAWESDNLDGLTVAQEELSDVLNRLEKEEGYEVRKARVWWRLGQCHWRLGGSHRDDAYKHYITALKRSPSFAPAFTSLGIYYLEHASLPDPTRASKCFQKAVELDAREAEAARRLAHGFAEEREWDLVEVIARRTIEGEGGLAGAGEKADLDAAAVARHKPTNAWAWKALGVVELTRRNYPQAIQALQVALRSADDDAACWSRLGEAYTYAGRHAAALKALHHSLALESDDWVCKYQIGEVQRQMGLYAQAVSTFSSVLEAHPREVGVLLALAQNHLALGREERATGYLNRAAASFIATITSALDLVEISPGFRRIAWKTISDALVDLAQFSAFSEPEIVSDAFSRLVPWCTSALSDERLQGVKLPSITGDAELTGTDALQLAAAVCSVRLSLFTKDDEGHSSAWFDLGLSLYELSAQAEQETMKEKWLKTAIDCVRQALVLDPADPLYWNAFGNLNFLGRPKIAQHAYIRALEIDSKNAIVWANLGLLYLHNDDAALANEAFHRAQTLDPDYTLAWVGQGLVATANGHDDDASALFEHAGGLTADLPEADLEFAHRAFRKHCVTSSSNIPQGRDALVAPFFSLDRYLRRRPADISALHLFGLVCERLGHLDLAAQSISRAIRLLEAAYEESEDPSVERRYAIANANLARVRLAQGDFVAALETFELAAGLLPSAPDGDAGKDEHVAVRALCQFGSGLAQYHLGELEAALQHFEGAMDAAADNALARGHVAVLLAQTMWAIGTDEFKESAKSQLLECISADPENLAAVTALAAMGLLTDDAALVDAALSEILVLPLEQRTRRDPARDIEHLLTSHHLAEGNLAKARSILQHAVHADPTALRQRTELATLSFSHGHAELAEALLSRLLDTNYASDSSSTSDNVDNVPRALCVLAVALATTTARGRNEQLQEARRIAQRAIILAPWDAQNWACLVYLRNMGQ